MDVLYIPRGKTLRYPSLACRRIINQGVLIVENGLQTGQIAGHGIVHAGSISAGHITAMEIEAGCVTADTLAAERICAAEVRVRSHLLASCYLEAEYVEAQKVTAAGFQVRELRTRQLCFLDRHKGLFWAMISGLLQSALALLCWKAPQKADAVPPQHDGAVSTQPAAGQKHDLEGDFEFLRLKAMYKALRCQGQGYTLRIVPLPTAPDGPAAPAAQRKAA